MIRDSRDFYLPSFLKGVRTSMALAFRINKPVKSIPEEFAHRYSDKFYPGLLFYGIPKDEYPPNRYNTLETSFNFSVFISNEYFPVEQKSDNPPLKMDAGNKFQYQNDKLIDTRQLCDSLMAYYSSLFLLKIGDFIVYQYPLSDPLFPGSIIRLYNQDSVFFDLIIK
jgi:hypothetical protein